MLLSVLSGRLGVRIPSGLGEPHLVEPCGAGDACYRWGDVAEMRVHQEEEEDICYQVSWRVSGLAVVEDCVGQSQLESVISCLEMFL